MKKGIYALVINGKYYIGKDHLIEKEKRIKDHINLLLKGEHYNRYLQKAFDKYGDIQTYIIATYENISKEGLSVEERSFIQKYDSYKNGYNLTLGGEGGHGLIITEERKREMSQRITGEKNPMAKLTNEQFFELVDLFVIGKSNKFIGELYDLHDRYVSLIRHKHRFKTLWALVENYIPTKSNDVAELLGNVTEEEFLMIVEEMLEGKTNAEIEEIHTLPSGTASRIRNRKLYNNWWEKHFSERECIDDKIKVAHQREVKKKLVENGKRMKGKEISESTRNTMRKNNGKRKGIIIDDVFYHSMMEAERQLRINRKVIAKRLKDKAYPNYTEVQIKKTPKGEFSHNSRKSKRICVDGIEYTSIMEASRQLGISNRTISERVKSESFSNYKFIEVGENPLSKKARKVIIDGIEYQSVNFASTILSIDKNILVRRLVSEAYPTYKYIENV
ncbi:hypothetical protein [Solibacillus sp. FSL K6-1126]|uniref:hypothetical protein n=1 Tax=Solibacillus sp. FSL K6-1126 TaxID=2921463 RepID=UPI0030FCF2CD